MNSYGSCRCGKWKIDVTATVDTSALRPRVCDCDYCKANPSALVSNPSLIVALHGHRGDVIIDKNGAELASFYRCTGCKQLLAVGCELNGRLRGAVNSQLLDCRDALGEAVQISPKTLSASEKQERWNALWGELEWAHAPP